MAGTHEIFVDLQTHRLLGDLRGANWIRPQVTHVEKLALNVRFLKFNPDGDPYTLNGQYSLVSVAGAALKIELYKTSDNTLLVTQPAWVTYDPATNIISGFLDLNTAAMQTAMVAVAYGATLDCTLVILFTPAGGDVWEVNASLPVTRSRTTSGAPAPAPGVRYLTIDESDARYLKKVSDPGETWTSQSPDGTHQRILGVHNDGSGQDDVV